MGKDWVRCCGLDTMGASLPFLRAAMLNPATIFSAASSQHQQALFRLNMLLTQAGLPMYHQGGVSFNTEYRMYPAPRWLFRWGFPPVVVEQIYLSYLPGTPEQIDPIYTDSIGSLRTVGSSGSGSSYRLPL